MQGKGVCRQSLFSKSTSRTFLHHVWQKMDDQKR